MRENIGALRAVAMLKLAAQQFLVFDQPGGFCGRQPDSVKQDCDAEFAKVAHRS
jgi:predicted NAD/FAD-dependent oxidoreductase